MSIWSCSNALRFERRPFTETRSTAPPDPMHYVIGKRYETYEVVSYREVLQQAWTCHETGAVEWKDVPVVDAEAKP